MQIKVDQETIDKLVKQRVAEFNKIERDLTAKLKRRDNKVHKLQKELELLKADLMDTSKEDAQKIARLAQVLVGELQRLNWVHRYDDYCCYCQDDPR